MSAGEFTTYLKLLDEQVRSAARSLRSSFDRITFKMLVDTLKSDDPLAVKAAIEQLVKEERPEAVAPLFVVARAHPSPWLRQEAEAGLAQLVPADKLKELTDGKDIGGCVKALVAEFGSYRG